MPPCYVDEDYTAGSGIIEPLPERSNWRGSESHTLENDVYVWRYALIVVQARNECKNDYSIDARFNFLTTWDSFLYQTGRVLALVPSYTG